MLKAVESSSRTLALPTLLTLKQCVFLSISKSGAIRGVVKQLGYNVCNALHFQPALACVAELM